MERLASARLRSASYRSKAIEKGTTVVDNKRGAERLILSFSARFIDSSYLAPRPANRIRGYRGVSASTQRALSQRFLTCAR